MIRVVGGVAGGRRLAVPPAGTRPTADRAREAMFSTLGSLGTLEGVRVLDLYAGSGAVGLEALSRGANHALLVESDRRALVVLRSNVATLGFPGARVAAATVEQVIAQAPDAPYDVLFADPPYALPAADLQEVLRAAADGGWLAADAVVVLERSARDPAWTWPSGYLPLFDRRYGEATLWYSHMDGRIQGRHATKATLTSDPQPEGPD